MKRTFAALGMIIGLTACGPKVETPVKYLIGVSQANLSEPWRINMTDEIKQEAGLHPELRVIVSEASDSLGKQIGDVERFEGLGIDLLIISPLESEALTPTVTEAFHSIPVIVVNRSVANDDYTVFIGPDNRKIGQEAGRFVSEVLKSTGGEVLEILGRSASPPTLERAEGFRKEIAKNPLIRLQSPVLANWLRDGAQDLIGERLRTDRAPEVIFAHNDDMAYGAWLAADSLNMTKRITFLGVDGLPGPRGGQELLKAGILDGTLLSPTGGKEAIEYAMAILGKKGEQPKNVILGTRMITKANLAPPTPPASIPRKPWKIGVYRPPKAIGWNLRLIASVEQAFSRSGWIVVPLSGQPRLPRGLTALVTEATDMDQTDMNNRLTWEAEAKEQGLPFFRVGPQPPQGDDSGWTLALGPDTSEEGRRAGWWLGKSGATQIWEFTGPRGSTGTADRSEGFAAGLADREAPRIKGTTATDGSREDAKKAVLEVLGKNPGVDGILAHSDEVALGALEAIKTLGKFPGRNVKVVDTGGGTEAMAALGAGELSCVVRSTDNLGELLRSGLERAILEPGVSRRLVTSHDVFFP